MEVELGGLFWMRMTKRNQRKEQQKGIDRKHGERGMCLKKRTLHTIETERKKSHLFFSEGGGGYNRDSIIPLEGTAIVRHFSSREETKQKEGKKYGFGW